MKIKTAVCDDEKIALQAICGAIKKIFEGDGIISETTAFSSLGALEAATNRESFDLIMLDIDMKEKQTGLDFAVKLRKSGVSAEIIFVSNREDKVFESFDVQPLAFVRKSKFISDFSRCLPILKEKLSLKGGEEYITLTSGGRIEKIPLNKIAFVEGNLKNQIYSVVGGEKFVSKKTMKETEEFLSDKGFCRIHSGYIVNLAFVSVINNKEVVLTDGTILPVARSRIIPARKAYLEWLKFNEIKGL